MPNRLYANVQKNVDPLPSDPKPQSFDHTPRFCKAKEPNKLQTGNATKMFLRNAESAFPLNFLTPQTVSSRAGNSQHGRQEKGMHSDKGTTNVFEG